MSNYFFNLNSDRNVPMRRGRGIGSGKGKTSGKGHKGQKARSGKYNLQLAYYGSQTPQIRMIPKRGFTPLGKKYLTVTLGEILYMINANIININNIISLETFNKLNAFGNTKKVKIIASKEITSVDNILNFGNGIVLSKSVYSMVKLSGGSVEL